MLKLNETEAEPGQEFDWQTYSLPFLVIEEIQLRNLSLVYTELDHAAACHRPESCFA